MQSAILGGLSVAEAHSKQPSSRTVLLFVLALCFICAFLLAVVSFVLAPSQEEAKEFERNKQMLIATKILTPEGRFQILEENGALVPAHFDSQKKILLSDPNAPLASAEEVKEVGKLRIHALLLDGLGEVYTFEEKGLTFSTYLSEHKKVGYAVQENKLFFVLLPNEEGIEKISSSDIAKDFKKISQVVIPISGFGLWAPIYGYLAVKNDGDTVVGATWYEHAETPGLGANITEAWWQKQFFGKLIFQESTSGETPFKTAPLGITVVKGRVKDVFGDTPRAKSAVDGISGATFTGDGVTNAYKESLAPYRPLFIKIHELRGGK